jgi:ABC-type transport system substrate-binding protein
VAGGVWRSSSAGPVAAQESPRAGGELIFVVPAEPPSYDAHREETFAVVHPAAPHYNTLLRVDPGDRTGTRIVGDLAASWTAARDGRTNTFSLRRGVPFHDGSELTSRDVKASYDKIILHGILPAQVARGLVRGVARFALQLDLQGPTSWPATSTGTRRTSWEQGRSSSSST